MPQRYHCEILEEQRAFCLHNFICAVEQVYSADPEKRKKGTKWMLRTLEMLNEIEEEIERAT